MTIFTCYMLHVFFIYYITCVQSSSICLFSNVTWLQGHPHVFFHLVTVLQTKITRGLLIHDTIVTVITKRKIFTKIVTNVTNCDVTWAMSMIILLQMCYITWLQVPSICIFSNVTKKRYKALQHMYV